MTGKNLYDAALRGETLGPEAVRFIAGAEGDELADVLEYAALLKQRTFPDTVAFCSIINARSGKCSEDCAFCAQSARYRTGAPEYPFVDTARVVAAARAAMADGATRLGIVTSGKGLSEAEFRLLLDAVRAAARTGVHVDLSIGIVAPDRFRALREAGAAGYHHNLETARSFFPSICTTHDYDEDIRAVRDALDAGFMVCSGGIFGLGESWEQRAELALTLRDLGVPSVPVNFLIPIPGTPMHGRPVLAPEDALRIVALLRFQLPDRHIRICGGRNTVFAPDERRRLHGAGASGIMVGDYLTTRGGELDDDLRDLRELGLRIES